MPTDDQSRDLADDQDHEDDALEAFGEDKFYRGVLLKLQRGRQRGIVQTSSGREVHFEIQHTQLIGSRWRWEDLHEGMPVGYDVGWTSHGLRVTQLKPVE